MRKDAARGTMRADVMRARTTLADRAEKGRGAAARRDAWRSVAARVGKTNQYNQA